MHELKIFASECEESRIRSQEAKADFDALQEKIDNLKEQNKRIDRLASELGDIIKSMKYI